MLLSIDIKKIGEVAFSDFDLTKKLQAQTLYICSYIKIGYRQPLVPEENDQEPQRDEHEDIEFMFLSISILIFIALSPSNRFYENYAIDFLKCQVFFC